MRTLLYMMIEEKRKKNSSHLLQAFRRPSQYLEGANVLVEGNKHDVNSAPQLSLSKTKLLAVFKYYHFKFNNPLLLRKAEKSPQNQHAHCTFKCSKLASAV